MGAENAKVIALTCAEGACSVVDDTSEYDPAAHHARAFTDASGAFYKDQVCHGALRRVPGVHAVHVHWVSAAIGRASRPREPKRCVGSARKRGWYHNRR